MTSVTDNLEIILLEIDDLLGKNKECLCIIDGRSDTEEFKHVPCSGACKKSFIINLNLLVKKLSTVLPNLSSCNKEDSHLIFKRILKYAYVYNAFDISTIYLPLFSVSLKLLIEFCMVEANFVTEVSSWEVASSKNDLLCNKYCQQVLFLHTIKFIHFLRLLYNGLMNTHGRTEVSLCKILPSANWISPLFLLSVLHHWFSIEDKLSLAPLLKALLDSYSESSDPLISQVALEKWRHLNIVQWCLECYPSLNIQNFLKLLHNHSVLYAMHACIPLQKVSYHKVKGIFLKISRQNMSYDESSLGYSCDYTFSGFHILWLSLNSIIAGIELDKSLFVWKGMKRPFSRLHLLYNQSNEVDINTCKKFYKQNVCKALERIIDIFREIYSIPFCLEILENIFSLLFVKHTNFSDEACSISSLDEVETISPTSIKREMDTFSSNSSVLSSFDNAFQFSAQINIASSYQSGSLVNKLEGDKMENRGKRVQSGRNLEQQCMFSYPKIINNSEYFDSSPFESSLWPNGSSYLLFLENCTSSELSSSSSVSDFSNCGYVMNILVFWDHLLLLQELIKCLKARKGDYYKSSFNILLSIDEQEVIQRLKYLEERVECALWRLKVLLPIYQNRKMGSEDEMTPYINGSLTRNFTLPAFYDNHSNTKVKNSKNKRKLNVNTRKISSKPDRFNIIQYLLSSPKNLLNLALVNNNIDGAQEVTEKYEIKTSKEKQELTLMKFLNENIPKMENISSLKRKLNHLNSDCVTSPVEENACDKIERDIQLNSSDVAISYLIEQIMNMFMLENPDSNNFDDSQELNIFDQFIHKLILADIALTSNLSEDIAIKLMMEAFTHNEVTLQSKISQTFLSSKCFLQSTPKLASLVSLLQEMKTGDYIYSQNFSPLVKLNPATLFLSKCPLTKESLGVVNDEWVFILNQVNNFNKKYKFSKNQGSVKVFNEQDLLSLYDDLKTKLETEICLETNTSSKIPEVLYKYLKHFLDHLKALDSAIRECRSSSSSNKLSTGRNLFHLLLERPTDMFGKLLFVLNIDPLKLDVVSRHLHMDLLSAIVEYAFPKVPLCSTNFFVKSYAPFEKFGCLLIDNKFILNGSKLCGTRAVHGDLAVIDLLSSLLDRLKDIDYEQNILNEEKMLTCSIASLFLKDPQIKSILLETCDIGCVDLKKLHPGIESLVFFINLANLMFLHYLLLNSLIFKSRINCSDMFSSSCLQTYLSFKHVGYIVGQLGFVSLYDILFKILKQPILNRTITENSILPILKGILTEEVCDNIFGCKLLEDILPEIPHELIFVVNQVKGPSPKINVYYPDTFEDELSKAISEYFNSVVIPKHSANAKEIENNQIFFTFLYLNSMDASEAINALKKYASDDTFPNLDCLYKIAKKKKFSRLFSQKDFKLCVNVRIDYSSDDIVESESKLSSFQEKKSNNTEKISVRTVMSIQTLSTEIISYVHRKCPVLNIFFKKVISSTTANLDKKCKPFNINSEQTCNDEYNSACLDRMLNLFNNDMQSQSASVNVSRLFYDEEFSSVLSEIEQILSSIPIEVFAQRNYEVACKSLISLFQYLTALPTVYFFVHFQLNYIWDQILAAILSFKHEQLENPQYFFFLIKDSNLRFLVIKEFNLNWPIGSTIACLRYLLSDKALNSLQKSWVKHKLHQMEIYSEIMLISDASMKKKILLLEAEQVLEYLNDKKQYSLLVKYAQCYNLLDKCYLLTMSCSLLECLDNIKPNFERAKQILDDLPNDVIEKIMPNLIQKVIAHSTRIFIIDMYLQHYCQMEDTYCVLQDKHLLFNKTFAFRQELMGLILVEEIASKNFNKTQLFPLIHLPHLILEQWIMNMKYDSVKLGIGRISKHLDAMDAFMGIDGIPTEFLNWNLFHGMIEKYSLKALDLSGIQVNVQRQKLKINESKEQFIISLHVPSKFEWQPNSDINQCPLCDITFSLFCRRHHCRRCGRVVCASCSRKRFKVENYSAPVRVCNYCYKNLCPQNTSEYGIMGYSENLEGDLSNTSLDSSDNSEIGWYFTADMNHIISVREEFSFDCAPSLSLFLAILSLHKNDSKAAICTLKLIHELFLFVIDASKAEISEVDINFVLRMIQTLLSSAKLRFDNITDYDGISLCEYYNQWADMLQLLINSKSVSLIPSGCLSNMLNTGVLQQQQLSGLIVESSRIQLNLDQERKYLKIIRDNLVKNEKWQQALNLSTKAGFETTGVWGALAMASLKAGDFAAARDHFSKVLVKRKDKNIYLKSSLLNDVITYLESQPQLFKIKNSKDELMLDKSSLGCLTGSAADALIVTQTLGNLNLIVNGIFDRDDMNPSGHVLPVKRSLDPILQRECEYYITLYGCHRMHLQFFLRHKRDFDAVRYSFQINISGEIFAEEVLLKFFRKGKFHNLWKLIKEVDPLEKTSPQIVNSSCKWLEKNKYLHCLLEVNKALKDRLRSAVILVRLYTQSADSFSELMNRKPYLTEALLNLQAYLNTIPLSEMTTRHRSVHGLKGLRLHSSSWVINQHIHLCNFQEDVIKYLNDAETRNSKFRSLIQSVQRIILEENTGKEKKCCNKIPTVFDKDERLVVCIIIICCGENIATGLNLVYRLIEVNSINPKELLGKTLKVMISLGHYKDMANLIKGILEWGLIPESQIKALLWPSIIWAGKNAPESIVKSLVKFLSNSSDKLDALVEAGLLKLAYFQIVESCRKEDFEKLLEIASKKKDKMVIYNCNKWIQNYCSQHN